MPSTRTTVSAEVGVCHVRTKLNVGVVVAVQSPTWRIVAFSPVALSVSPKAAGVGAGVGPVLGSVDGATDGATEGSSEGSSLVTTIGPVDSGVGLGPNEPGATNVDSGVAEAGGTGEGLGVEPDPTQPASTIANDAASPASRGREADPNLLCVITASRVPPARLR
jgi:hypothetical protein